MKIKHIVSLIIILGFSLRYSFIKGVEGQDNWINALENAELRVVNAFRAVQVAENEGADVHDLTHALNDALALLNEAKNSYNSGNFTEAIDMAERCSEISASVESAAIPLTETTIEKANVIFSLRVIYTVIALGITAVGLLIIWRIFERRYKINILKAKPEVMPDES